MDNTPLYEIFFDMQLELCNRFASLSPFEIRRQTLHEVILLTRRLQKCKKSDDGTIIDMENQHIRRPAMNDDWY